MMMFYVHIWNRSKESVEGKQSLCKIKLSAELSNFLVTLEHSNFKLISDFCLADYSLFDPKQFKLLIRELEQIAMQQSNFNHEFLNILGIIEKADHLKRDILFDPFGE